MGKALELVQKQVDRLVKLQSEISARAAQRDLERAEAERQFETDTAKAAAQLKEFKEQLEAYAIDNRDELFPGKKKSLKFGDVEIGFRYGTPVIHIGSQPCPKDKLLGKLHDRIAETSGVEKKLFESCIVIKEDVSLPKIKELPEEQFDSLGVKLVQPETFFVKLPEPPAE